MVKVFPEGSKSKKEVFLRLDQQDDSVRLLLVDASGNRVSSGTIAVITESGITLLCDVTEDAPFALTAARSIVCSVE